MTTTRTKRAAKHLTTKTAVGYIRVSTNRQAQEGESLEVQKTRIEAYCTLNNLDLVKIVQEPEAISGGTPLDTRPGGAEVLRMLDAGEASHVVALKLDRLFRSSMDCAAHCAAWSKAGVALHLVDMGGESLNSTGAVGRMFMTVLAGFAEFERGLISERTEAALRQKRESGRVYSGVIPFGFTRKNDTLTPNAEEQKAIATMARMHKAGKSFAKIAATLNKKEIPTRTGAIWYASTVNNILRTDRRESAAPENTTRTFSATPKKASK